MQTILRPASLFLTIVLTLAGASHALAGIGATLAKSPTLERVVDKSVLRVAMTAEQPPFSMRDKDGKLVGYDVDLANALARAMQVDLEVVELPFAELIPSLTGNKADVVISGMSITPERSLRVSFVGPYTLSGKSILTTQRIKKVVKDPLDFNDSGIRLVALDRSTSAAYVKRNLPKAQFDAIDNYNEGIEQLLTGQVDAMVADIPILKLVMLRHPEAKLDMIEPPLSIEPLGLAIRRDDSQFEILLRNYLRAFDKGGLLARLQRKWFEDNSWVETIPED